MQRRRRIARGLLVAVIGMVLLALVYVVALCDCAPAPAPLSPTPGAISGDNPLMETPSTMPKEVTLGSIALRAA